MIVDCRYSTLVLLLYRQSKALAGRRGVCMMRYLLYMHFERALQGLAVVSRSAKSGLDALQIISSFLFSVSQFHTLLFHHNKVHKNIEAQNH